MKKSALLFGLAALALAPGPVLAQGRGALVAIAPDSQVRLDQLARETDRARSIRAIKNLQYLYTQYGEFGLWDEMGSLFADNGELQSDGRVTFKGKDAIAKHLRDEFNGGKPGLPPGGLHTDIMMQPVVTLSYDGNSATARWSKMTLDGQYAATGGKANWLGGMQVNDYVKENGVWKIARINFYAQYSGPYETGFFSSKPNQPLVPYHYTPAQAERPVPDEPSGVDKNYLKGQSLAETERRIQAMNDENQIRNLQNIYGYYIDRKMWSDVTDLFTDDGALEIAGQGIWNTPKSIRRALEVAGPEGLRRGQVNDHIQENAIITVDGNMARARGMELAMLTPKLGEAYWAVTIFENRYVKGADGKWRIREMRLYPKMKADYYQGWGKSNIVDPKPGGANAPDRPSAPDNSPQISGAIPVFDFPNPVTGKPALYPAGAKIVGGDALLPPPALAPAAAPAGSTVERMAEARRKLALAKSYDAVENASNTFGYYLDDTMWDDMADNFAASGTRPQGPGFYVGRDHIVRAMTQTHFSGPPSPTNPRLVLNIHQRVQPVIEISPDGTHAKIRTRLFLYHAQPKGTEAGTFGSGMYPSETAVLEGGYWKMDIGGEIDETYFSSSSYKDGWAKPQPRGARAAPAEGALPNGQPPLSGITNEVDFPPDIARTLFDNFRWKDMQNTNWPEIKPMWFAYRNPVSGRTPPNYCPNFMTCGGY